MSSINYQASFYLIIGLSFYMAYCDIKTMRIKLYLQSLFLILVSYYQVTHYEEYKLSFFIALLSFLLFLKGNLGGADKKLIPLQGLALSLDSLVFYYFLLSFFYSLQIYIKRKNGIKRPLPFYPIILLAFLFALVIAYLH